MNTRLFLVFLSVVAGTMAGLVFSRRYVERERYFDAAVRLAGTLICDIRFRKETLKGLLTGFCEADKSHLRGGIREYLGCIEVGSEIRLSRGILTKEETRLMEDFFRSLGVSDAETQIYELEGYKARFADRHKAATEKNNKYGKICVKLGFLLGLAVGILML